MSISESELLHACHYAIDRMIENGSVEYICFYGGKWHGTSWLDVVNEIDNRLSKIEAEGGDEDGRTETVSVLREQGNYRKFFRP